jgi:hypothetical protein
VHLLVVDPHLPEGDAADAPAKRTEGGVMEEKQALGSSPEGTNHLVAITVVEQQHWGNRGVGEMEPAQETEVAEMISCDQNDIGWIRLQGLL